MIPLSLLSSVELGLVMVPQGLERLSGGRLVVLFRVEHGLSVLGDAVLLVSVEQGLMPWLVREHCGEEKWKKGVKVHQECTLLICQWRMKSAGNKFTFFCSLNKKRQENKATKNNFPTLFGRSIEKNHCLLWPGSCESNAKNSFANKQASMTHKPKAISTINGARLKNYTLICLEEPK